MAPSSDFPWLTVGVSVASGIAIPVIGWLISGAKTLFRATTPEQVEAILERRDAAALELNAERTRLANERHEDINRQLQRGEESSREIKVMIRDNDELARKSRHDLRNDVHNLTLRTALVEADVKTGNRRTETVEGEVKILGEKLKELTDVVANKADIKVENLTLVAPPDPAASVPPRSPPL